MRRVLVLSTSLVLALGLAACKKDNKKQEQGEPKAAQEKPAEPPPEQPKEPATESPDAPVAEPVSVSLDKVEWHEAPPFVPKGAQIAVVEGTPPFDTAKTFAILVKLPKDYQVPPHTHPGTERVTIVQGSLYYGHGDTVDKKKSTELKEGAFWLMPAGHQHYVWTKDPMIMYIQGIGPFGINYINPKDDPRQPPPPPMEGVDHDFEAAGEAMHVNTPDVKFGPAPEGMYPAGIEFASLEGTAPYKDPKTFTYRVKLAKGAKLPAHSANTPARIHVVEGSMKMGMGDKFDEGALKDEYQLDDMVVLPANTAHFGMAGDKGAVLQIYGVGPFELKWLEDAGAQK